MIATKVKEGYKLESPTIDGVFVVKMTLNDTGEESIEICSGRAGVCFPVQKLNPGTIEKIVGPQRWRFFQKLKEEGVDRMFLDPQKEGRRAPATRSW